MPSCQVSASALQCLLCCMAAVQSLASHVFSDRIAQVCTCPKLHCHACTASHLLSDIQSCTLSVKPVPVLCMPTCLPACLTDCSIVPLQPPSPSHCSLPSPCSTAGLEQPLLLQPVMTTSQQVMSGHVGGQIGKPYRDAHDRLLWKDKTCPART